MMKIQRLIIYEVLSQKLLESFQTFQKLISNYYRLFQQEVIILCNIHTIIFSGMQNLKMKFLKHCLLMVRRIFLFQFPAQAIKHHPQWFNNFNYAVEKYRGQDFTEDLFNHGNFQLN